MIKAMDGLLKHWADQWKCRALRQCSPLGKLIEFKGVMPDGAPKGSRDPLGHGEIDDLAWEVYEGVGCLTNELQVLAWEHYHWEGYNEHKAQRLGLTERTYYNRLNRLHIELREVLRGRSKQIRRA